MTSLWMVIMTSAMTTHHDDILKTKEKNSARTFLHLLPYSNVYVSLVLHILLSIPPLPLAFTCSFPFLHFSFLLLLSILPSPLPFIYISSPSILPFTSSFLFHLFHFHLFISIPPYLLHFTSSFLFLFFSFRFTTSTFYIFIFIHPFLIRFTSSFLFLFFLLPLPLVVSAALPTPGLWFHRSSHSGRRSA